MNNDPVAEARQAIARARSDVAFTLGADGNRPDLERVAGDQADTIGDQVLAKEADELLKATGRP